MRETGNTINGVSASVAQQIEREILAFKRPEKIVIFGSRATGDFKNTSDIDIAVFAESWSDKDINLVKNRLDERVKTPLKFDLVNFYAVSKERLRKNILENGRTIYESPKN